MWSGREEIRKKKNNKSNYPDGFIEVVHSRSFNYIMQ